MFKVPETYRIKNGPLASDDSYGNAGAFQIPHPKIDDYYFFIIASDGEGWEHVAVTVTATKRKVERCPTWEEMCHVKGLFWSNDEVVVQYHPAESDYVNNHAYCLHLWKPIGITLPVPNPEMVGIK